MIDFRILLEIKKDALESIKSDSGGDLIKGKAKKFTFLLLFTIVPFIASLISYLLDVKLSDLSSYITTGIAIFTGLFFSLLLSISTKIRIERENENIDKANFRAFKENMRQISNITQYIIVLGILIMLLVLLNFLLNLKCSQIELCLTSIAVFLLIRYFICILLM